MLALAPTAMAQSSSVDTYGGAGGEVQSAVGEGAPTTQLVQADASPTVPAESSALPFTGLDIGLALGGALLLIGVGAGLALAVPRREETRTSS